MRTPVCDFVAGYAASDTVRLHMPGHKGVGELESLDITEVKGADSLYEADGIIAESEKNASELFGSRTFYSTEGSSHAIRAMLYLATLDAKRRGIRPLILAGRNAHRVFISAAALIGFDVEWLPAGDSYLSAPITKEGLRGALDKMSEKPAAVYLTSPDYLGFTSDISGISEVCLERGILLLVDNAHGAYLKFLTPSRHPIDLGADMCADSAHKTLPALTGGAYLHISAAADERLPDGARSALALFGSTSPSYLILASLDKINPYLKTDFAKDLSIIVDKVKDIRADLEKLGYSTFGDEEMKITINAKNYGYLGDELAELLRNSGIEPEFSDRDFLTLMPSPSDPSSLDKLFKCLSGIKRRKPITERAPRMHTAERVMSIREATLSPSEVLPLSECVGRILATAEVSCPPAVPILIPGERIAREHLEALSYYGTSTLRVLCENI